MLFGARLLQKTAMLVTSAEREVEPSIILMPDVDTLKKTKHAMSYPLQPISLSRQIWM